MKSKKIECETCNDSFDENDLDIIDGEFTCRLCEDSKPANITPTIKSPTYKKTKKIKFP